MRDDETGFHELIVMKVRGMRRKPNNKMNNNNNRRRFRSGGDNNAGKIKSAAANRDKYLNLARDAMAAGDRVEAENYLQHADHYFRVLSFLQEEDARNRPAAERSNADMLADDQGDEAQATDVDGNTAGDDSLAMAS